MNNIARLIPANSPLWPMMTRLRWLPLVFIAMMLAQCAVWVADRDPPFIILSYNTIPAKPGGILVIDANVQRDLSRECSVELSSSIFDSAGVRWDYGSTQSVVPEGIRELDAKAPGKLLRKIQLPPGMTPGPGTMMSSMTYRCNMLQEIVAPIYLQTRFDFEVLPL